MSKKKISESKRKSLYAEIIEFMEGYRTGIKNGDKHYNQGVLGGNRSSAIYCMNNCIGSIKAIYEARKLNNGKKKATSNKP